MTYLDYINLFWREDDAESFSIVETRLYFLLLKLANRNRWLGDIVVSDKQLTAMVGVSLGSFKHARDVLRQRELIDCDVGGRGYRHKTRYRLRCEVRCQVVTPKPSPILINKNKSKNNYNNNGDKKGFNIMSSDFD